MAERAESGSPWLPETKRSRVWAGRPERPAGSVVAESGRRSRPRSIAVVALSTMRRPRKPTSRPCSRARSATRWMRGIEVAKQETSTFPRVRARTSRNAGSTSSSPPVAPRCSTLVESESSASTPRSPHAARASRSVRSSGGASASILKSPLVSTTPAFVSMARARLSVTLWATRMGWRRKGPSSTGVPGTRVRSSALIPRSCSRRRAKPRVNRLP